MLHGVSLGMPLRDLRRVRPSARLSNFGYTEFVRGARVYYVFTTFDPELPPSDGEPLLAINVDVPFGDDVTNQRAWAAIIATFSERLGMPPRCIELTSAAQPSRVALFENAGYDAHVRWVGAITQANARIGGRVDTVRGRMWFGITEGSDLRDVPPGTARPVVCALPDAGVKSVSVGRAVPGLRAGRAMGPS